MARASMDANSATAAVTALLSTYCHTADGDDVDAWLACFAAEGTFTSETPSGEQRLLLTGHEQMREWFETTYKVANPVGTQTHVTANALVRVSDPDHAEGTSTYLTVKAGDDGPVINSVGTYTDRYVRGEDGAWRFEYRRAVATMRRTVT